MKIILAVDENWGIGLNDAMLYDLKTDLKHFKDTTYGSIIIMGRSTYESMGRALPGRENIVLTRNPDYRLDEATVFHTVDEILDYVKDAKKEVFVIGGEKIVEAFLPYCDEAIITKIYEKSKADTFLHNFDKDDNFKIIDESKMQEENGIEFNYVTYRRK